MAGTSATRDVLEHGTDDERRALESLASHLRDSRATMAAPGATLPGLGTRPDAATLDAALARNQQRLWNARRRLYASALNYQQAAERLDVSDRQISNLVAAGRLLALDGEHGKRLPAWQFHPETTKGRVPEIEVVAAAYPGRLLSLSDWMVTPNPVLDGRAPLDVLVDGQTDRVVAATHALL